MLVMALLMQLTARADTPDRIHGFRIGVCGGFSTECVGVAPKIEYAGRRMGINLSTALAYWAVSVRAYPLPEPTDTPVRWRPYVYGGGSLILFAGAFVGGGVGADIHLLQSRRLCLQPSLGIQHMPHYTYPETFPAGSLGVMYTF